MKLAWQRPGVVLMTARVEEVAALVAAARIAVKALEGTAGEDVSGLTRVLSDFDRASKALAVVPAPAAPSAAR